MEKTEVKAQPSVKVLDTDEIPHILKAGEVGAVLEVIVKDNNGKVTEQRLMKSESFVRQFIELLQTVAAPRGEMVGYYASIRDTSNTVRSMPESAFIFSCNAGVGVVTHGIVVGTGIVAPNISDYALGTLIAHGVGAGQLQYSDVSFGAPASDATTSQFTITRNFANGSGGAITVNEIGLYVRSYLYWGPPYYYHLSIRDVIGGGISVPNGQTLTVNYRIQATV